MKYAVEYNVYATEDNKKFDSVYFDAEDCIDEEEFNSIVKGKKNKIVEDFETYGLHTNEDKTETKVIYTRGPRVVKSHGFIPFGPSKSIGYVET